MIVEKNRNLSKLIQSLLTLLAQKPKDDTHGHGQKSYFGQNALGLGIPTQLEFFSHMTRHFPTQLKV